MIVEEDAVEMVDLVLEDDCLISAGGNGDLLIGHRVERLDDDFEIAIDISGMFVIHRKAAFAIGEVTFFHRVDDDLRIDELVLDQRTIFVFRRIGNDEHTDTMSDLGSRQADAFTDVGVFLLEFGILGQDQIFEHFVDERPILGGEGERDFGATGP